MNSRGDGVLATLGNFQLPAGFTVEDDISGINTW